MNGHAAVPSEAPQIRPEVVDFGDDLAAISADLAAISGRLDALAAEVADDGRAIAVVSAKVRRFTERIER